MDIRENVELAPYTTLQVGGPARYFATVTSVDDLRAARQFAQQTAGPLLFLGSGSNLLISDTGFPGLVIYNQLTGQTYTEPEDSQIQLTVGAGEILDEVIAASVARGYWGLENLSHIPGTIGATPVQNVGAYGVEIADVLESVSIFDFASGEEQQLGNADCQFAYRDSVFKQPDNRLWYITSLTLRLSTQPNPQLTYPDLARLPTAEPATPAAIRDHVIRIRAQKFPDWHTVGTAGSFFKNPIISTARAADLTAQYPDLPAYPVGDDQVKVSLGYILDQVCGLRGHQTGSVGLYEQQALVLINQGGTAADISAFAETVKNQVAEATGLTIEQEVTAV